MKTADLTEPERKLWQATATGELVDLREHKPELDNPEKGTEWGPERTVRAEVIAALLLGDGEAASMAVRRVRLQGARIMGELDLEAATLRCPLALLDCSFASTISLDEATALSVRLSGSHTPTVRARQLQTRGDLRFDEGFSVSAGVDLAGSHIGGDLSCRGGQFFNFDGSALFADRLIVDGDMLCDEGFIAEGEVSLLGAHIGGLFSCRGGQFFNSDGPALFANSFTVERRMLCDQGFSAIGGVSLTGAHIGDQFDCRGGHFSNPMGYALLAYRLTVDGDMLCGQGFIAEGEVSLTRAHIGGVLDCSGHFSNPTGYALNAFSLTVERDMFCGRGFSAEGGVSLTGAHIGGLLDCGGGQFTNPMGRALDAGGLTVERDMLCGRGFSAQGEVSLTGAHIGGLLSCSGGHFSNPTGDALNAYRLTVEGDMRCSEGFTAEGGVSLTGAHIGGLLDCSGGHFSNPMGRALDAGGLTVGGDMLCGQGFTAQGEVSLAGAHIGRVLNCRDSRFSNPDGLALSLFGATVSGTLFLESVELEGTLNLTAAKTSNYYDNPAFWPEQLWLDGFVYENIEGASTKERLKWLLLNERGYSPQIYDQLAAVYRSAGHDDDARRVLVEKQRRRFAERGRGWRIWGYVIDGLVGYGYHTERAALWLIFFWALGTVVFWSAYLRGDLTPANKPEVQPPFQPIFYTLDLLLPVVSLHVRDAWIARGFTQVWSVIFIIVGWVLASAVVVSLASLLKRD